MTGAAPKVLVVRRGALGDTILMVPALRMLRASFREHELVFAGNLDHAALLPAYGIVDRAISSEDLGLWRDAEALTKLRRTHELVLAEGHDFDARIGPECDRPAAEAMLARLAACVPGAAATSPIPDLRAPRTAVGPGLLVVAPGAGSPRKRAPLARFAAALAEARAAGCRTALVLGEVELAVADAIVAGLPPTDETWSGLTVVELARRLEGATGFVGNDSGVTHLAAALGVPTTALFTTTDPRIWAPTAAGTRVEVVG